MLSIDHEVRVKAEALAKDIAVLLRQAAVEAVAAALGAGATAAAPVTAAIKRGRGRPRKAAMAPAAKAAVAPTSAKAARGSRATVSRKATSRRAPGEKRPPAELVKLTEKLGEYIKAHPGTRMEAIAKGMGVATKELNLPIKKLLGAKRVRSEGQKRATEYFPA